MEFFVVFFIPSSKNYNKFKWYLTIFKFSMKREGPPANFISISVFEFNETFFMFVILIDEGNEFICFDEVMSLFFRMEHEDFSVRFYFGEKYYFFMILKIL